MFRPACERGIRCLLLDNHLPDMDGIDVLKELAARNQSLPIVVVTGLGDEQLVVQVLGLGVSDYVPKQGHYLDRVPGVLRKAVAEHRNLPEPHAMSRRRSRRILYVERHAFDVDLTIKHFAHAAPHLTMEIARSRRDRARHRATAPERLRRGARHPPAPGSRISLSLPPPDTVKTSTVKRVVTQASIIIS
jgi:DNA-binding response OmpR family regulator